MIYETRHLIPVFIDVITVKLIQNDVNQDSSRSISIIKAQSVGNYQSFIPLVSHSGEEEEQAQKEEGLYTQSLQINLDDDSQPVTISLDPGNSYSKDSVDIIFSPGDQCKFGNGHACIYQFSTPGGHRIILVSVHSGAGGDADDFRDLIEGTGINQALFDSAQVMENMKSLAGSAVSIVQGDQHISGLVLEEIIRVPPEQIENYTKLPIDETLDYALRINAHNPDILNNDLLVIETCGWKLPDETLISGVSATSSSVYLGIVDLVGN